MPTFLLDTCTFSAMMHDDAGARRRLGSLGPSDRMVVCTIVRGEILYGLARLAPGRRRRILEGKAESLFSLIACEGIPKGAADIYAQIKRDAERRGHRLDENDLWIAATALELDATLVTSDSDFQRIAGLVLDDWAG